jgi:putative membrane protein
VLVVVPLLIATSQRFPLTPLLYALVGVHAAILMLGGHYSYARVPAGFWVQDLVDLSRNHYDRLGHFAQGFVPAIAVREVLLRTSPLRGSRWLPVLTVASCLAISACYEFLEWWTALGAGATGVAGRVGEQVAASQVGQQSLGGEEAAQLPGGRPGRTHDGEQLVAGVAAEAFLATQGDVWDTQWDMFLAVTGAIAALVTLARVHDRALDRLLRS